ncbi:MAG: hypothetical protein IMY71_12785 [Bacteroidetes bacterium]|nr:hypothetical protein [Bacteroidota bacterium]
MKEIKGCKFVVGLLIEKCMLYFQYEAPLFPRLLSPAKPSPETFGIHSLQRQIF